MVESLKKFRSSTNSLSTSASEDSDEQLQHRASSSNSSTSNNNSEEEELQHEKSNGTGIPDISELWLLDGEYYDFSSFLNQHPGGAHVLYQTRGRDITELFHSLHLSDLPHELMAGKNGEAWKVDRKVARMKEKTEAKNSESQQLEIRRTGYTMDEAGFYKTLRRRIRPVLEQIAGNKKRIRAADLKAPFWWNGVIFGLTLFYFTSFYFSSHYAQELWEAFPITFCCWLYLLVYVKGYILGAGHEAIHGNLGPRNSLLGVWNDFMADFFTESLGFPVKFWIEEHCLMHHVFTGRHDEDPDETNLQNFVRMNGNERWIKWWHGLIVGWMNVIVHTIISLIVLPANLVGRAVENGIAVCLQGFRYCSGKKAVENHIKHKDDIDDKKDGFQRPIKFDREVANMSELFLSLLLHILKQCLFNFYPILLAYYQEREHYTGACIIYFFLTCLMHCAGLHLFHGNHILEETKEWSAEENPSEEEKHSPFYPGIDWGAAQINTTSNYDPTLLIVTGWLENQIEHHLFPTLSVAYAKTHVKPIVEEVCKEFGLKYKSAPTAAHGVFRHLEYLSKMGRGLGTGGRYLGEFGVAEQKKTL